MCQFASKKSCFFIKSPFYLTQVKTWQLPCEDITFIYNHYRFSIISDFLNAVSDKIISKLHINANQGLALAKY
jgi:hypothetical protein